MPCDNVGSGDALHISTFIRIWKYEGRPTKFPDIWKFSSKPVLHFIKLLAGQTVFHYYFFPETSHFKGAETEVFVRFYGTLPWTRHCVMLSSVSLSHIPSISVQTNVYGFDPPVLLGGS